MYEYGGSSEAFRWWYARNRGWLNPTVLSVTVALVIGGFVWWKREQEQLRLEREAAAEIERLGGTAPFMGERHFFVVMPRTPAVEEAMARVGVFRDLISLSAERSPLTDEGLQHV